MQAFALFSHQLYPDLVELPRFTVMCLIEDARLFRKGASAAKAIFHRAALQAVRERLLVKGYVVRYYGADEYPTLDLVLAAIEKEKPELLRFYELGEGALQRQVETFLKKEGIPFKKVPSPAPRYILKPSTDFVPKALPPIEPNRYVEEAASYYFDLVEPKEVEFAYPVTRGDAEEWLDVLPEMLKAGLGKEVAEDLAPLLSAGIISLEHLETNTPPDRWAAFRTLLVG